MRITIRQRTGKLGEALFLDITHKSKRKKEYLGLYLTGNKEADKQTLKTAEMIRIKRLADLQQIETLDFEPEKNLFTVVNEFIETKDNKGTKAQYLTLLKDLKNFNNSKDVKIKKITPDFIEKFNVYLLQSLQDNTAKLRFTLLKTVLNYAIKKGYLNKNPFTKVEPIKTTDKVREYLTFVEIEKLIKCETKATETKRAFLFCCFTGLRFSDVKTLTYGDIKENIIQIKMKKTNSFVRIPLNDKSKVFIYDGSKVIPLPHTKVFELPTLQACEISLKRLFKKAGIEKNKVSFHLSRHTFATLSLNLGIDIYTVSKLLGHKDLNTTQIYAKLLDNAKIEAMNKFNNL